MRNMAQEYNIEQLLYDSFHNGPLHHEQEKESINIQGRIGFFGTQTRILYTSLTRRFLPLGPENLLIVLTIMAITAIWKSLSNTTIAPLMMMMALTGTKSNTI